MGSNEPSVNSQPRELFGGAITASIPADFLDISPIREIPDNQEVFSHAETDRSIIIELLEQPDLPPGTVPASFHSSNIAEDSSALEAHIHQVQTLPASDFPLLAMDDPALSVTVAYGTHVVAKFRDAAELANHVDIFLACVRLPRATTDLLIVFNDPVALHPAGASARSGSAVAPRELHSARDGILRTALRTLKIHNWGLLQ